MSDMFFHPHDEAELDAALAQTAKTAEAAIKTSPKLILFDLDGTLLKFPDDTILPGVKEWFAANKDKQQIAIVSNCGGVGLRFWQEKEGFGDPDLLPTEFASRARIANFMHAVNCEIGYYVCFAYQSKKSGNWGPTPRAISQTQDVSTDEWNPAFRKPMPGMLIRAMADRGVEPADCLMVGDWPEDREAAKRAGCQYADADDFFQRRK